MTRRPLLVGVVGVSLALAVGACQPMTSPTGSTASAGTAGPGGSSVVPDGASSQPDGSAGPVASTGAEASVAPGALGIGSGPFFLSDPRSGLDALPAYEETLTIAFSGTVDGAPRQWSTTHRFQHTATPAMSMLTIEAGVGVGAPVEDPVLVAEGSGAMYEQAAAGPCMGRRLDPTRSRLAELEPAAQIPGLMGADEAGSESLSGVATKHYRFDGRAILEGAGPQTTGDVWVAAADGSVRKYVRSTTADAGYFGGGMAGTMTWTYGLRELDAATRVALPRACQLDVPVMSGATDLLVLPTYAGFDTSSTVAQVAAFYKAQLPPAGWAYASTPVTSSTQVVLTFKSGARVLNVIVTAAAAGRRVDLALVGG